ncbi:MAG: RDD family protein [Rhodanobacter sp.]
MDTLHGERQPNALPMLDIAGFWRRLNAFVVDCFMLGIVGLVIGSILFDPLAHMGSYARLIGFAIALAYFGICNSRIGNGQTLAKRWFGIRVVDAQSQCLSLPRSLLRYAVLGIPYFVNGLPVSPDLSMSLTYVVLVSLIVFGAGLSIIYLYIFNRRTRQSLHDLVVGSYVVRVQPDEGVASFPVLWGGHWVAVSLLVVLAIAAPFVGRQLSHLQLFAGLTPLYQTLSVQPHVVNAQVQSGWQSVNGQAATHYLSAQLRVDKPMTDDADYARGMAQLMAKGDPHLADEDAVRVGLVYGYDMGIASWWTRQFYSFKSEEFR